MFFSGVFSFHSYFFPSNFPQRIPSTVLSLNIHLTQILSKNVSISYILYGVFLFHNYISSFDFLQGFPSIMFSLKNSRHIFLKNIIPPPQIIIIYRIFLLFSFPESSFSMITYNREYNIFLIGKFSISSAPLHPFQGFLLSITFPSKN